MYEYLYKLSFQVRFYLKTIQYLKKIKIAWLSLHKKKNISNDIFKVINLSKNIRKPWEDCVLQRIVGMSFLCTRSTWRCDFSDKWSVPIFCPSTHHLNANNGIDCAHSSDLIGQKILSPRKWKLDRVYT